MCNLIQLVSDRLVDLRDTVAMNITPEAGNSVDIAPPLGVDQEGTFAPLDCQKRLLSPLAHGREWMPQMSIVQCGEVRTFGGDGCRRHYHMLSATEVSDEAAAGSLSYPDHGPSFDLTSLVAAAFYGLYCTPWLCVAVAVMAIY